MAPVGWNDSVLSSCPMSPPGTKLRRSQEASGLAEVLMPCASRPGGRTPHRHGTGKTTSDGGLRRDVDDRRPGLDRMVVAGDEQVDGRDEEEGECRPDGHAGDEHE